MFEVITIASRKSTVRPSRRDPPSGLRATGDRSSKGINSFGEFFS
jgi:hypothetical protein